MRGVHLCSSMFVELSFPLLLVHVVGADLLPFEVYLEDSGEKRCSGLRGVVFVAEVVPFGPFVDEDAQVGGVLVESKEEFIEIASGVGRLHVHNDVNPR